MSILQYQYNRLRLRCSGIDETVIMQAKAQSKSQKNLNVKWHPTKNHPLSPFDVVAGSHIKAWWICDKGHEWEAYIRFVALRGTSCPICSGHKVLQGYNDLATLNPVLAKEWDYSKNTLTPQGVSPNYNKKAWWKCGKCGRSWEASINSRNCLGVGCACVAYQKQLKTKRRNKVKNVGSLATNNPKLAREWHPTKNSSLKPTEVTQGAGTMVWWLCQVCKYEWEAAVYRRDRGTGCPKCSEDSYSLAEENPILAREWHPTLNNPMPEVFSRKRGGQKVWWLCSMCKHEWRDTIRNRNVKETNCPKCVELFDQKQGTENGL
jgi:hypothetical protein